MVYYEMVWAFTCEWSLDSLSWVFTLYGKAPCKKTQFVSTHYL